MPKTLLQYFEWYLPDDGGHWKRLAADAAHLKEVGFTDIWLPPAYKGADGCHDAGYGVYDLYDLGEFDQKGTVPTKYGTKEEYIDAIESLHQAGLRVISDIVLNHRMGADGCEDLRVTECAPEDRNREIQETDIRAWTVFDFPGRNGKYSDFRWNHTHFDGVDWDDRRKQQQIYQFEGKRWDRDVDEENGNFDYLMGTDLDTNNQEVIEELDRWGEWYLHLTGTDGFRIDAVKHIRFDFFTHWLGELRRKSGKELWAVGEYWHADLRALTNYMDKSGEVMNLFDVPLHFHFAQASSSNGQYDMRRIFDDTLVSIMPDKAVTFADNHDTQPGQALESWVLPWFKPLAYALILLRQEGTPCVFYGDYYGIPHDEVGPLRETLDILLKARCEKAFGQQTDYFDDFNIVGWTRAGDEAYTDSGCAVLMTDGPGGEKEMHVGIKFAGRRFRDLLHNRADTVEIDEYGNGVFSVSDGSVSVYSV